MTKDELMQDEMTLKKILSELSSLNLSYSSILDSLLLVSIKGRSEFNLPVLSNNEKQFLTENKIPFSYDDNIGEWIIQIKE